MTRPYVASAVMMNTQGHRPSTRTRSMIQETQLTMTAFSLSKLRTTWLAFMYNASSAIHGSMVLVSVLPKSPISKMSSTFAKDAEKIYIRYLQQAMGKNTRYFFPSTDPHELFHEPPPQLKMVRFPLKAIQPKTHAPQQLRIHRSGVLL